MQSNNSVPQPARQGADIADRMNISLLRNKRAILGAWLAGLAGLFIVVISYVMFMPLINFLVALTTSLGAPAAQALFYAKMALWFFVILGVACIIYPFAYTYKKTHDQGQDDYFGMYR